MDAKVQEIFSKKKSALDSIIVDEIKNRDAEFFTWFCFLRANFLRGKYILSNRAFEQFVKFCRQRRNDYYFNEFPRTGSLLPHFKPKFLLAKGIEKVLEQLRRKYASGYEFVKEVRCLTDSFEPKETHRLYLELIARFMSFEQIGSKIANAILNEIIWEFVKEMQPG